MAAGLSHSFDRELTSRVQRSFSALWVDVRKAIMSVKLTTERIRKLILQYWRFAALVHRTSIAPLYVHMYSPPSSPTKYSWTRSYLRKIIMILLWRWEGGIQKGWITGKRRQLLLLGAQCRTVRIIPFLQSGCWWVVSLNSGDVDGLLTAGS